MTTKSIKKAYALWFFGGLFGLHHFYLGRDKQAFIWLTTLGGFFIGFLRDLYKIPEYVRESNEEKEFLAQFNKKKSQLKTPLFKTSRFVSSIAVGTFFGYLTKNCMKNFITDFDELEYIALVLSPLIVSIVVYLIGTEGSKKCNFKWPLLGSYVAFLFDLLRNSSSNFSCVFLSTLFLNWNIEWDKEHFENKKKRKLSKRIFLITLGAILFALIFALFVWNNASYQVDGKKVTLKESVYKIFESEEAKKLAEVAKMMWNFYKAHGLKKSINHMFYGYDPEMIAFAYKVYFGTVF